jgi:hypothetical protein
MEKQPYKLAQGNPAGSLAQSSLSAIGEALSGRANRKAEIANKMLDSELSIRQARKSIKAQGKQDRRTARTEGEQARMTAQTAGEQTRMTKKTEGKVARRGYASQVKTNVKAAERLTGAKKGKGVTQGGTKLKMTPDTLEITTKKPKAPAARGGRGASSRSQASVTGTNVPKAPVQGVAKPRTATPRKGAK